MRDIKFTKKFESIILELNKELNNANIKAIAFLKNNKSKHYNIDLISEIPKNQLMHSHFIDSSIKHYINNNSNYVLENTIVINNKKIKIAFIDSKPIPYTVMRQLLSWLYFIDKYSTKQCSKELKICIYLTPFKKLKPPYLETLSSKHVNSGVSNICTNKSNIMIFRKEEWFKVLIHESFHNFGLDFANMNNDIIEKAFKKMYKISATFILFESYCEFWARFLNILCTLSFTNSYTKNRFLLLLNNERKHTIKQAVNVLNHMNIDYLTINTQYKQYKESTNVFVYYVSTAVLFYYPIDFVLWCNNNNNNILNFKKTNTNLRKLLNYYRSIYNSTELLETFSQVNKSSLTASLKMSIVDI